MAKQEALQPALAEPNMRHRELQQRKVGYFIDEWCHPGEQEGNGQKPGLPDVCMSWILYDKIIRHHGLEFKVVLGADLSEVRSADVSSSLQVLRTALRSVPMSLCQVSRESRWAVHLRTQELKPNLGPGVTLNPPEIQACDR